MPRPAPKGKRTGFTTGACAAAAAKAATEALLMGRLSERVTITIPNGSQVTFAVHEGDVELMQAHAVVIKDAGDDPDRTHGAQMTAHVEWLPQQPGVLRIEGGKGVGRVTRPGLGLEIGGPAINPIPRENIEFNVRDALTQGKEYLVWQGLQVLISVPGGEQMAEKTLNPRLGIVGGISILGTSGIVHPYSTSAYRRAMAQGIMVLAAQGESRLVLTTGRRTERFAMAELPDLPEHCFVQMGDFIGAALQGVAAEGMRHLWIGAMAGKLAKIAQGADNTHAHKTALDMTLVARLAARAGGSEAACKAISEGVTVRSAAETLREEGLEKVFLDALAAAALEAICKRLPAGVRVEVLAFDFSGALLARRHSKAALKAI